MRKGKVTFDEDYCKGCGLCVAVCPTDVLALSPDKLNAKGYRPVYAENPDKCIACQSCAITCPDSVISVYQIED